MARGIQHHFHDAFDVAVGGLEGADVYPQAPGDGGTDLPGIELFAFDFAALENVRRQRLQDGLLLKVEAEPFHAPDQAALPVTGRGEGVRDPFRVPMEPGPVLELMDIHSPHLLRRL